MTGVAAALGLLLQLIDRIKMISGIILQAQSEGRTKLTDAEWKMIDDADVASRQKLVDAIARAKAEGR